MKGLNTSKYEMTLKIIHYVISAPYVSFLEQRLCFAVPFTCSVFLLFVVVVVVVHLFLERILMVCL